MFSPLAFHYRIPEEHREKIEDWLGNDFRRRIDGRIPRSRCLFLVGPTQYGIYLQFFSPEECRVDRGDPIRSEMKISLKIVNHHW